MYRDINIKLDVDYSQSYVTVKIVCAPPITGNGHTNFHNCLQDDDTNRQTRNNTSSMSYSNNQSLVV